MTPTREISLLFWTKIFCVLIVFLPAKASQGQVIPLPPISQQDVSWSTAEREYFSDIWKNPIVTNVAEPSITHFAPTAEKATGTAVIICPGGGLYALSIESEGTQVAQWLADHGVHAFVLKYRLIPTGEEAISEMQQPGSGLYEKADKVLPLATEDALNAIQHVRENAAHFGVDPQKIGIIGFSAGGAVTMSTTYQYDEATRPNFIGPIYAWMNVVAELGVPDDAPPMFAMCATDDPLQLAPASVKLYQDWIEAGKSAELHMYAQGGHGFGMKKQDLPSDHWIERLHEWMGTQGF